MEALLSELTTLRARLDRLEARVERCEARLTAPKDPAELDGEAPAAGARMPGRALAFTGQTLAEKVLFLDAKCREVVPCAAQVLVSRGRMAMMSIDETRGFSSAASRCAHDCAVELAVTAEAQPPVRSAAPDEDVGMKAADEKRGVPAYPGPSAPPAELRSFLSLRCPDLACARLAVTPATGGEGPAVQRFLATCAEACAAEKGLDVGQ